MRLLIPLLLVVCELQASITVAGKGTNSIASATTLSVASVALVTGDLLVVTCTVGQTGVTASWNSTSLSLATSQLMTGVVTLYIFYLPVTTNATASVTLSWTSNHSAVMSVTQVKGIVAVSPLDKVAAATANNASPSSGATATTSQAVEISFGAVGTSSSGVVDGTWSGGYTPNQSTALAASDTISDAYLVLSSTGAQTAAKTGITSGRWGAAVATFKGISGACSLSLLGVGQC